MIARIRPQVKSAHALVSTSGVLVTTTPRARQAGTIDVVVADRDVGHDLQLRPGGVQHGRINRFGEQAHDGVLAGHALQQLFP